MSTKPTLYYGLRSPPSRAVLLTAAAIGLELDLRTVDVSDPELEKRNPVKTVPVLDDNGVVVNDSHVINAYLVDKYAKDDSLYPKDPQKRREVDTLLFLDASVFFPRCRLCVDPIFYNGAVSVDPYHIEYMQHAYDLLEKRLANTPYVAGDNLTIADFSALTSITAGIIPAPLIEERHPKVKAWIERLSQLPYYAKINLAGMQVLGEFIKNVIIANMKAKAEKGQ